MNVTINKSAFVKALSHAVSIIKKRTVQPILMGVQIFVMDQKLHIISTDLDMHIKQSLDIASPERGYVGGSLVIEKPKELMAVIKAWPKADNITLSTDGNLLTVNQGQFAYSANTLDPQDFPLINASNQVLVDNLAHDEIDTIINRVAFAAATYDTSSILGAVNIKTDNGNLDVCATDGSRLVHYQPMNRTSGAAINKHDLNIPCDTFKVLGKLLGSKNKSTIHLYKSQVLGQNCATITGDNFEVSVRLIAGDYPRYSELFPKQSDLTEQLCANRVQLLAACKTAAQMNNRTNLMRFDGLEVKTEGTVIAKLNGFSTVEKSIGLNANYLADFISTCKCERVELASIKDPNKKDAQGRPTSHLKPFIIQDHDIKYLLMPVRCK